jgi:hypothetical protein
VLLAGFRKREERTTVQIDGETDQRVA